jgi:hypothetical protein
MGVLVATEKVAYASGITVNVSGRWMFGDTSVDETPSIASFLIGTALRMWGGGKEGFRRRETREQYASADLSLLNMNWILLADGSRVDANKLIGDGADGFIILEGKHVLKIPRLLGRLRPDGKIDGHIDDELHLQHLELKKEVYKRLIGVPGIAKCIECTNNGILPEHYSKGSLSEYISSAYDAASMSWRWFWILQATDVIARCHEKGVLVYDIALRSFLLADDLSLRLIDFANSAPLPEDMDITRADIDGCTARLDLHIVHRGQLI